MRFSIYRYNPEQASEPYMREYEIDVSEFKGDMLLDALECIKTTLDPTLAFRRSCGEGVCGSDGMNINGRNGLACITPLSELGDHVKLLPLTGFPVQRDLIVDLTQFYKQYEKTKPYFVNDEDGLQSERLQSQEDRNKLDGLYECILCACCTSFCPSYWWNPENFLGPAALLSVARFTNDSRDMATDERLDLLKDPFSLFKCRSIMNCTAVCPKELNPTEAISKLRIQMIKKCGKSPKPNEIKM